MVKKISNNEVYLPAIQRKFVWTHEKIEKLFDSIMLGYPIGTFLFWGVQKSEANEYTFYKFIQEYHQRDNCLNELAPKPEMKESIIGVLDGQQRLSSMYLGLQGSYAYKKPKARWDNDDAFPKRHFYFNLLRNTLDEDEEITYEFKFLTDKEAINIDDTHFWFPVKEALRWEDANDYINYASDKGYISNKIFINNLTLLWQRITQSKIINYFEVINKDLDSILDIFIRVNSGGAVLSKSDLLFSTIVANWEDSREQIEDLLKTINNKGDKFNFDNDFIMKSCLFLTDCPILFKVNNFKKDNVEKIKNNWNEIKNSIKQTVDLLVEFGFSQENLTSLNSVIPIAYYIIKSGNLNNDNKRSMRLYLITSLLKRIFGGRSDQLLESIRNSMREKDSQSGQYKLKNQNFDIISYKLPQGKSFVFTEDDIENLFEYKKGPYTFMVLSLLYPNLKYSQIKFHQDHLHPASLFTNTNLKANGIDKLFWKELQDKKDKLGNLQLLEGRENQSKNKSSLEDWLNSQFDDSTVYKLTNYIPDVDLSLNNFKEFFEERKKLMINKLKDFLKILY
nr:DUF262 domain-containing protein [Clostridium tyrobutyricum]